jgi:osmotically-inducible protein OsmY
MRRAYAAFAALGAALMFFFDPRNGRRRRAEARDRFLGLLRRGGRRAGRLGRGVAAEAYGVKQKATHLSEEEKPQPDDVTLAHEVETEIFRDADVPKGQINVNAEEGKVVLRGVVDTAEMIDDLIDKTRRVQGVREVESLLHLPDTPAPHA